MSELTKPGAARALSDIEIAQAAPMQPISAIAASLGLSPEDIEPYGQYKAKLPGATVRAVQSRPQGKLVLVTATSPTPTGEGKTTTSVGLVDALNRLGTKAMVCLREPSMGPVFGMKGGAAGGGYAQINPMTDINLHFTGDFAAISAATNLLAAMVDNHMHHSNSLRIDPRKISWARAYDVNDRALRHMVVGMGGSTNGFTREAQADITAASEVMAILCLAKDIPDLRARLGRIVVGRTRDDQPVTAADLHAEGAMTALLIEALNPNLVQTLEGNPAIVHGGPFANIAHGCNSLIATETALHLADVVITEAGFGADLGAEKFFDLKCRFSGLRPSAVVLVGTVRSMKYHGGVQMPDLGEENLSALQAGMENMFQHLQNLREVFQVNTVVAINRFPTDTDAEIALMRQLLAEKGVPCTVATHHSDGGAGAMETANAVLQVLEDEDQHDPQPLQFCYDDDLPLVEKITAVAERIYRAGHVHIPARVRRDLAMLTEQGHGHLPVCIAKTQYSFSTDAALRGAPQEHELEVRSVRLAAGAGFVVVICGSIMTMPGLSKSPAAERIDVDEHGNITGMF